VYVIIVGGGAVGVSVSNMLTNEGYAVTIIEKDEARAEELHHLTKANIVVGDATNPRILEMAEIEKAKCLIAVTGDEKTNVIVSILAQHYNVENIVTRVVSPPYRDICLRLGIKNIINPAETVAIQIDALLRGIKFIDFVRISGEDVEVEEIVIRDNKYINKDVRYLSLETKDKIYPLFIMRGSKIIIPEEGVKLREGDKVLILRKRRRLPF